LKPPLSPHSKSPLLTNEMASELMTCRAAKTIIEAQLLACKAQYEAKQAELHAVNALELELIEKAAEEQEQLAREAMAAAADLRASMVFTKTTLPVFCTADEVSLRKGNVVISDFNDFVAFSYQIKVSLWDAFQTMSEEEFKQHLTTLRRCESGEKITANIARKIFTVMKLLTDNMGKLIVVAVAGSKGGGLEIRRITGQYRYSENFHAADGTLCYFHQFPTEFIRALTPDESKAVAEARPNCYALNWSIPISI